MSDLIDRQAALDALGERPMVWAGSDYELGARNQYDADVLALETVPSAQPEQQWIPCSERLPEDHEPKLLTHEVHYITGKVIKDVRMAYYDDENDDWLSDEESPEILCYPLAWMPLPEPYKEDDHETD